MKRLDVRDRVKWLIGRHATPGTSPGTLSAHPEARPTRLRLTRYGPEGVEEKDGATLDEVGARTDSPVKTWIAVEGLGDVETLRALGERFGLHRLELEDVVNVNQRPKVEEFADHLFIVTRVHFRQGGLKSEQVSLALLPGVVISFHERDSALFDPVRKRLRDGMGRIRSADSDYLCYALLDTVVDCHFPLLEEYDDHVNDLEERIMDDKQIDIIAEVHHIKRDFLAMRRFIWPLREAIHTLMRDESDLVKEETILYLRDCHDHAMNVLELIDSYREIVTGLMDMRLSIVSNRMNEVMTALTIVATIFIPLTFIAGIYGMNFDSNASPWNMPELKWRWGYPICLGLMLALALGLVFYFRKRGWLGKPKRPDM